eukprot:525126-Rhodomonas_salina.2
MVMLMAAMLTFTAAMLMFMAIMLTLMAVMLTGMAAGSIGLEILEQVSFHLWEGVGAGWRKGRQDSAAGEVEGGRAQVC